MSSQEIKVHIDRQAIQDFTDEAIQELYRSTAKAPESSQAIETGEHPSKKMLKSEHLTPRRNTKDNPGSFNNDYMLAVPQDARIARSTTVRSAG